MKNSFIFVKAKCKTVRKAKMQAPSQRPGPSLDNTSMNSEEQMAAAIDDLVQQARRKGK